MLFLLGFTGGGEVMEEKEFFLEGEAERGFHSIDNLLQHFDLK